LSWTLQESGTINDLHCVCFADTSSGIAVGASGTILGFAPDENVAVMLREYAATWVRDHAEIAWSVTGAAPGSYLTFDASRSDDGGRSFFRLAHPDISGNGANYTLHDTTAGPGSRYIYRVIISEAGREAASFEVELETPALAFSLMQNHPNPFNPSTTIDFTLTHEERAVLEIFDITGGHVRTVIDRRLPAGRHTATWGGRNEAGTPVASGLYFYRLTAGKLRESRKMVLMR
jgi:hypothetical protein